MSDNVQAEPGRARPGDSLKQRIWMRMLTVEQHTMLTTVMFFLIVLVGVWIGVNEPVRMQQQDEAFVARSIQRGAVIFDSTCATCHGKNGEGSDRAPALNVDTEFNGSRLKELGYAGSLRDYFMLTVSAGRPARSNVSWPEPMPTWGQDYGGPLRPDQVNDVVNFVMNWGCDYDYTYDPICQGKDQAREDLPTSTPAPPTPTPKPPVDINELLDRILALQADPQRGEDIFFGRQLLADGKVAGCSGCHTIDGTVLTGPTLKGAEGDMPSSYNSYELYVLESMVDPAKYKVPGFENVNMPPTFYQRLTDQDMADLLAYVLSVK